MKRVIVHKINYHCMQTPVKDLIAMLIKLELKHPKKKLIVDMDEEYISYTDDEYERTFIIYYEEK